MSNIEQTLKARRARLWADVAQIDAQLSKLHADNLEAKLQPAPAQPLRDQSEDRGQAPFLVVATVNPVGLPEGTYYAIHRSKDLVRCSFWARNAAVAHRWLLAWAGRATEVRRGAVTSNEVVYA